VASWRLRTSYKAPGMTETQDFARSIELPSLQLNNGVLDKAIKRFSFVSRRPIRSFRMIPSIQPWERMPLCPKIAPKMRILLRPAWTISFWHNNNTQSGTFSTEHLQRFQGLRAFCRWMKAQILSCTRLVWQEANSRHGAEENIMLWSMRLMAGVLKAPHTNS